MTLVTLGEHPEGKSPVRLSAKAGIEPNKMLSYSASDAISEAPPSPGGTMSEHKPLISFLPARAFRDAPDAALDCGHAEVEGAAMSARATSGAEKGETPLT